MTSFLSISSEVVQNFKKNLQKTDGFTDGQTDKEQIFSDHKKERDNKKYVISKKFTKPFNTNIKIISFVVA